MILAYIAIPCNKTFFPRLVVGMNWTVESNQMQWETRVAQELRSQLRQTACMPIPQSLVSVWSLNAYQSAHFGCLFLPI